ncbi:SDR family NAD(P)-dependent oxidoreductase [Ruania alba]|uniref:Short-chain dehydrogenase n=1 Tax=Ruania alba TaxID=648782 RepID=A0A1H5N244_9MICO|nr:SDR family oxidoreductase [Ruania alba]SEE95586.1 hypothetical protein SAMN04488554_3858 [Ruania alba]
MSTALITGASSGIGLTFARHLAQRSQSLVLVARNAHRLEVVAAECRALGAPTVEVLPADLATDAGMSSVADRLRRDDLHTLVNNAGLSIGAPFVEASERALTHQLAVNVEAVLRLTRAVLPGLTQRGAGVIINVASVAALLPGRGSTYSASKAWVLQFTEGLAMNLFGTGVRVQALCPGFVRTEFHDAAGIDMSRTPDWMYTSADHVVAASLRDVGRGKVVSVPGVLYSALAVVAKHAPRGVIRRLAAEVKSRGRD